MSEYTFYEDNDTDKEYQLSEDVLEEKYREWMDEQDRSWLLYYEQQLDSLFIAYALNSVAEEDEDLEAFLKKVRREYFEEFSVGKNENSNRS